MRVLKIINNNVVSSMNNHNTEVILMGRGIGFHKKIGDVINDSMIEKVFTLKDAGLVSKLEELIQYIPEKYLEISEEIVKYAEHTYGLTLRDNIYISLTDHISFSVERIGKGMEISNVMLSDIKCFYKREYKIGQKALQIIYDKSGVMLPDDEAGFIALHILNASTGQNFHDSTQMIQLANDIMQIVKDFYNLDPDMESMHYFRFSNHVHVLAQRLTSQTEETESDDILYETSRQNFPREFDCVSLIARHIKEKYGMFITKEEMGYLMINLKVMLKKETG